MRVLVLMCAGNHCSTEMQSVLHWTCLDVMYVMCVCMYVLCCMYVYHVCCMDVVCSGQELFLLYVVTRFCIFFCAFDSFMSTLCGYILPPWWNIAFVGFARAESDLSANCTQSLFD